MKSLFSQKGNLVKQSFAPCGVLFEILLHDSFQATQVGLVLGGREAIDGLGQGHGRISNVEKFFGCEPRGFFFRLRVLVSGKHMVNGDGVELDALVDAFLVAPVLSHGRFG
jgi:hypothetical protein